MAAIASWLRAKWWCLGQVVGDVLLTQSVVDVPLHGRQRVLVVEVGAGDEHHSDPAAAITCLQVANQQRVRLGGTLDLFDLYDTAVQAIRRPA